MQWPTETKTEKEAAPIGNHLARLIRIIDIGTRIDRWKKEVKKKRTVILCWELPNARLQHGQFAGQPFVVSKWYTQHFGPESNLRKDLESWRDKKFTSEEIDNFQPRSILGTPCSLHLTRTGNDHPKVGAINNLPHAWGHDGKPLLDNKGRHVRVQISPQILPSLYLSLERDQYVQSDFDLVSPGLKRFIVQSPEWRKLLAEGIAKAPPPDEHEESS